MSARATLPPDVARTLIADLREEAEWHRLEWRACAIHAGELENALSADQRHVQVKPTDIRSRRDYEVEVIQIAYELGEQFMTADVVAAGIPYPTALRWLRVWEERGSLESMKDGARLVWARTATVPEVINRRKEETPEAQVVRLQPRGTVTGVGSFRSGSKLVDELIRQVAPQGLRVRHRKHKYEFVDRNGLVVANCSTTPGASSLSRTRGQLRQNGFRA